MPCTPVASTCETIHALARKTSRLARPVAEKRHENGGRAVAARSRSTVDEAAHEGGQAGNVEWTVFHLDGDVVGPGCGGRAAAGVRAVLGRGVVDRLFLFEKLESFIDLVRHAPPIP